MKFVELKNMTDELNRLDKHISSLQVQLDNAKKTRIDLIESEKNGLQPMCFEIEKTIDGWILTFPDGDVIDELDSLTVCEKMMKPFWDQARNRQQAFQLKDNNSNALYSDYRNIAKFLDKEKIKEATEKERDLFNKRTRKVRNSNISSRQTRGKKIDTRIFEVFPK
jgi:hypothetical protein